MGSSRLGWPHTIATGFAFLFLAFGAWGAWTNLSHPLGVDFISFWSAGQLAVDGHPSSAYDIGAHRLVEQSIVPEVGLLPFPYPPPFLIIIAPFALLPFPISFFMWVVATAVFYTKSAIRFVPLPYALANPPVLQDLLIGQTGLLTGGLFIFGVSLVANAPFAAGVVLGFLILKPQIAMMLPIAALAGRHWHMILGAVISSVASLIVATFLFGIGTYEAFFAILPHYASYIRNSAWNWVELASPFAFARDLGLSQSIALLFHSAIAAGAATLIWISWSRDWKEKVPVLAAASLLASPYLLTYDAVLLIIPAAHLLSRGRYWETGILWVLCALPVAHFFELYDGPNTIPVAAILSLWLMSASHLGTRNRTQLEAVTPSG